MGELIKGYYAEKGFTSAGAGTFTWCIATRDGKNYFLKQFLSPVLVSEESKEKLPPSMVSSMQKSCVEFVAKKKRLYSVLQRIQTGAFIVPEDMTVYNGHYLAVSEAITQKCSSDQISSFAPWYKVMLMRTLVLCLMTLSENHIVHSDIKLDNLMITEDGCGTPMLKLIDFDSSFFEDDPPLNPNDFHGDQVYFAPEAMVFQNSEGSSDVRLNCKMDQFALGLVLHQMWCGTLPVYNKDKYANVAEALLLDDRITFASSLPPRLNRIISGFVKLDSDERMSYREAYALLGEELSMWEQPFVPSEDDTDSPKKAQSRTKKVWMCILFAVFFFVGLNPFLSDQWQWINDTAKAVCTILLVVSGIGFFGVIFHTFKGKK